ncbi:MAG TPA: D-amino-acid transaminase [Bacillales bacterium]|nr:D-amino-acid transaminase [Bacillales bacterium]
MILFQNQFMDRKDAVVDIEDRGYQFGDGIYEVIRVYGGRFFGLEGHMERLVRSTGEISMELPMPADEMEKKLTELVQANNLEDGIVYLQITRGAAPRSHEFPLEPKGVLTAYTKEMPRPLELMKNGIQTVLTEDVRWLRCDIKSLNLLANVMAKQEAKERGCTEAVFHRGDTVTEGSSSNLLIVKNGEVQTHPANNLILNGITRKKVFELAENLGLKVTEEAFTIDELFNADEAFITSTTSEVTPVVQVDDTTIGTGQPGQVTRKLQEAFEAAIASESYAETN